MSVRMLGWCALAAIVAGVALGATLAARRIAPPPASEAPAEISAQPGSPNEAERAFAELEGLHFAGIELAVRHGAEAQRQQHRATAERAIELTDALLRLAPEDPRTVQWVGRRWSLLIHQLGRPEQTLAECVRLVEDPRMRGEALVARAAASLGVRGCSTAERVAWTLAAEREGCDPARVALAWCELASDWATTLQEQRDWLDHARRRLGDDPSVRAALELAVKRVDLVGTTPELVFDVDVERAPLRLSELRGRPVVLLVWSGDSPRVLAAIHAARELQHAHAARGLHVLGAHEWRIDGGRQALRARLRELDFEVPHFYEEPPAPWDGALRALGVREVPTALLIDTEGRVEFASRRIESLAPLIQSHLAQAAGSR